MNEEFFQHYHEQAVYLRQMRFRLSNNPSQDEIFRFLKIESAVEKFFFEISVSGGAEADNILTLQRDIGGPCQKEEMQRASSIKEKQALEIKDEHISLRDNNLK